MSVYAGKVLKSRSDPEFSDGRDIALSNIRKALGRGPTAPTMERKPQQVSVQSPATNDMDRTLQAIKNAHAVGPAQSW